MSNRSRPHPTSRGTRRSRAQRLAAGKAQRGGFSFLEILVALAILGSAFTVLLAAHASASRQAAAASRLMTATLLARQILTETEVDGFSEFGSDAGDFGEDFPGYAWERMVATVALPIETGATMPSGGLREVTIRVTWTERGETRSTELTFYTMAGGP